MFTSRTFKPNKVNNDIVDEEVLALLSVLDVCYYMLVTRENEVLTRFSTPIWLCQSAELNGKLSR